MKTYLWKKNGKRLAFCWFLYFITFLLYFRETLVQDFLENPSIVKIIPLLYYICTLVSWNFGSGFLSIIPACVGWGKWHECNFHFVKLYFLISWKFEKPSFANINISNVLERGSIYVLSLIPPYCVYFVKHCLLMSCKP